MVAMPPVDAPERPTDAADVTPWTGWPLALPTAVAALAIAVAGLLVAVGLAVVSWFLGDDSGSSAGSVRTGAVLWLAAHGSAPTVGGVQLSLVPLLAPLAVGVGLARAGRWAVDASAPPRGGPPVARAVASGALSYGVVIGLVAWGVATNGGTEVVVDAVRGMALSVAGAGLALAVGIGRPLGTWADLAARCPAEVRAVGRGAAAGMVALLGAAALVTVSVLVLQADRVLAVGSALSPGLTGGAVLALVCAATLPNAVLWSCSYLVGPGFAVGSGSVVAPGAVVLGTLPGYPLLGALPSSAEPPAWAGLLIATPILSGVLAGLVAARALPAGGWARLLLVGTGAGLAAGTAVAALMTLSGGAVGPDRMQETGPLAAAGAVAVLTLALSGSAGAGAHAVLGWWRAR